jgi:hypothetical protein
MALSDVTRDTAQQTEMMEMPRQKWGKRGTGIPNFYCGKTMDEREKNLQMDLNATLAKMETVLVAEAKSKYKGKKTAGYGIIGDFVRNTKEEEVNVESGFLRTSVPRVPGTRSGGSPTKRIRQASDSKDEDTEPLTVAQPNTKRPSISLQATDAGQSSVTATDGPTNIETASKTDIANKATRCKFFLDVIYRTRGLMISPKRRLGKHIPRPIGETRIGRMSF